MATRSDKNITRTTIEIDTQILEKAKLIFKDKSQKEIVALALSNLVEENDPDRKDLRDLFKEAKNGRKFLADGYEYKNHRGGRELHGTD